MNDAGLAFPMAPGMGHNKPPIAELLAEETRPLKARLDELVETAGLMEITDDDSAGRATALVKMIKDHAADIEKARKARKEPNIQEGRAIDGHFGAMVVALIGDNPKQLGGAAGPLATKIDALRRKREAEAAAERARLEEEARQEREKARKAEEARQAAEAEQRRVSEEAARKIADAQREAEAAGHRALADKLAREKAEADAAREREEGAARERKLEAEIEQRRAADAAAELERRAADTKAAPIGAYGAKAGGRKVYKVTITDLTAAIKHCRKVDEANIRAAVQTIYDRQVKAGVKELPGADISEDSTTVYR